MYSILLSDYEKGIKLVKTKLQNMIKNIQQHYPTKLLLAF